MALLRYRKIASKASLLYMYFYILSLFLILLLWWTILTKTVLAVVNDKFFSKSPNKNHSRYNKFL